MKVRIQLRMQARIPQRIAVRMQARIAQVIRIQIVLTHSSIQEEKMGYTLNKRVVHFLVVFCKNSCGDKGGIRIIYVIGGLGGIL